ncbi:hypothetical protein GGI25_006007 [Coemansia spiralis]|uniref:Uncharacterized protein n=1 Tax=Coemansia spiralis TaxID=417178 RepID=A0A9W8G3L7_9FUNG|nr:hypothetical protein GGI25_006007 [Coemansia spiralis]
MYTSQQASYKALPSSTRSRRVSGNHAASRPALQHAVYKATPVSASSAALSTHSAAAASTSTIASSNKSGSASATKISNSASNNSSSSSIGVTLQSWARSQYQLAQSQTPPHQSGRTSQPAANASATSALATASAYHAANYHFLPRAPATASATRPQSSGGAGSDRIKYAVADYFDPYRSTAQGQTLDIDAGTPTEPTVAILSRTQQKQQQQQQRNPQNPPSPVMRATRHSRPSTPTSAMPSPNPQPSYAQLATRSSFIGLPAMQSGSNPPSAQSSIDSLRAGSGNMSTTTPTNSSFAPGLATQPSDSASVQKMSLTPNRVPQTQHNAAKFFSPQAVRHIRNTAAPGAASPSHTSSTNSTTESVFSGPRTKPRSYTGADDSDVFSLSSNPSSVDVRPLRPPPLPYPTRPRVSSMYVTSNADDGMSPGFSPTVPSFGNTQRHTVIDADRKGTQRPNGELASVSSRDSVEMKAPWPPSPAQQKPESRARKAESPTKLELPSVSAQPWSLTAQPAAGDPKAARPIAMPKQYKQQQQQGRATPSGSQPKVQMVNDSEAMKKKSDLIEFIELQRQQHQAKLSASAPKIVTYAALNTSNNSNIGSASETKKPAESKPQTSAFASYITTASKPITLNASSQAAPSSTQGMAKLAERSDSTSSIRSDSSERSFKRSTVRLADIDPGVRRPGSNGSDMPANPRMPKYTSWYGNVQMRPSTDSLEPTHSSPGLDPVSDVRGLPQSTRIVPRTRAQTHASPEPSELKGTGAIRTRNSNDSIGSSTNIYARSKGDVPFASQPRPASAGPSEPLLNPFARNPRFLSVSVQTDDLASQASGRLKPLNTIDVQTRGVQTKESFADMIHSDDAVLDLMRQMDGLRTAHSNQVTEYQEQVLDLELFNQDLSTEIEQLTSKLDAREAEHAQLMDEMRTRLETTTKRVEREINEVKAMHASKCDELAAQVCLLLQRCESYKQKLVAVGVSEDEVLQLATTAEKRQSSDSSKLQIADLAFIEKQYVETRESSQEADYFKQLMDIERSMENTTMALGFELKRTQAKYLQQAADFIREQMAKLQIEGRSESRLSMRSPVVRSSSVLSKQGFYSPDPAADEPLPSLAASLMAKSQALPPLPPTTIVSAAGSEAEAVRVQTGGLYPHRRIAGPEVKQAADDSIDEKALEDVVNVTREDLVAAAAVSAEMSLKTRPSAQPMQGTEAADQPTAPMHSVPTDKPFASRERSPSVTPMQPAPRWATLSGSSAHRPSGVIESNKLSATDGLRIEARGFNSESRTSGLSRMINAGSSALAREPGSSAAESDADLFHSSSSSALSSSPRRSHRSPLSNIASGFFSASQDSISTVATSVLSSMSASISGGMGLHEAHLSSGTLVTPTKKPAPFPEQQQQQQQPVGGSFGYFSGQRSKPEGKPQWRGQQSRSNSIVLDSDMTAEQLLESLKLPTSLAGGTPSRGSFSSLPRTPTGGSLGRHSPLPRAGSFSDLTRAAPRFSESPSSDSTLPPFDPRVEINLNLGLEGDRKPAAAAVSALSQSTRRHNNRTAGRRPANRRRSRSVGPWGAAATKL